MALGIDSIQKFQITIGAGVEDVSTDMEAGTDPANCVPFLTTRMSDATEYGEGHRMVRVDFTAGSPPTIDLARYLSGTSSVLECEVTVVEFDSTDVGVEAVAWTDPGDKACSTVTQANSFVINTYRHQGTDGNMAKSNLRCSLNSAGTLVEINVGSANSGSNGVAYVVEAKTGGFTVQQNTYSQLSGTSGTVGLGSTIADFEKAMLIVTHESNNGTVDDNALQPRYWLDGVDDDNIYWARHASSQDAYMSYFLVEFASGGDQKVQRGVLRQQTSDPDDDVTIVEVNDSSNSTDSAMGWIPCTLSQNSSCPGTDQTDNPDAMYALDITDSTTLNFKHNTDGGEADNYISWEVVEWDHSEPAAGTRRVMVIS